MLTQFSYSQYALRMLNQHIMLFTTILGLDVDGLYRVSGSLTSIMKLRYLIDRGRYVLLKG